MQPPTDQLTSAVDVLDSRAASNGGLHHRIVRPHSWKQMKAWRIEEAAKLGIGESAVSMRLARGKYKHLISIRRKNPRVVLVRPNESSSHTATADAAGASATKKANE